MTKRIWAALALTALLSGCGLFRGENKPKTAVLGERLPVLRSETDAEVEPALAEVAVAIPAPEANKEWAQPGGNAAKAMGNVALGAGTSVAWTASIAGSNNKARLAAGPVIGDGRVYVIDVEAVVHAFSLQNGARLWSTAINSDKENRTSLFGGGVSYDGGKLYATSGLGDAVALNATNGSIVWKKRPAGPLRGAPSIGLGNIYVLSSDNQIFALNAQTGALVWNEAATIEVAGVFGVAAPAIAQGTVVAGFSSGELTAFRYENGRTVWQDALSRTSITTSVASLSDIDASPVIDGGRVYAVGEGGRMVALDLISGQRIWELNIAGISTPAVAGDWLFVVSDDAKLLCIQRTTGKVRWLTQLQRFHKDKKTGRPISWVGPVLAGGRLILANSEGEMLNVAAADGKIGGRSKVSNDVYLPPVVADNMLVLLDNKGRLTAYR